MSKPFVEAIASSNRRLAVWFLLAIGIAVGSIATTAISAAAPYHGEIIGPFLGGAMVALALASWSLDPEERRKEAALRMFWRPLAEDVCVVLPSIEPDGAAAGESLFTVYHDAVASYRVQDFIYAKWGSSSNVTSSNEVGLLADVANRNLLLVGGPNFNRATALFMDELWQQYGDAFFQWSSSLAGKPETAALVGDDEDHLLKVENSSSEYSVSDLIRDVKPRTPHATFEARGMCVRAHGVLRDDRTVVLVAGIDTAFGTLAAAQYALDPINLLEFSEKSRVIQLIVGARVYGSEIGRPVEIRTIVR